jgi:hypothetical protein
MMSQGDDPFVWRFRIDEKPPPETSLDPGRELLRVQWEELLKLSIPMHENSAVAVDGFALMRDPDVVIPIFGTHASVEGD